MNHYRIRIITRGLSTLLLFALTILMGVMAWKLLTTTWYKSNFLFSVMLVIPGFVLAQLTIMAALATRRAYQLNRIALIGKKRQLNPSHVNYNWVAQMAAFAVWAIFVKLSWDMIRFMQHLEHRGAFPAFWYFVFLGTCILTFAGLLVGMAYKLYRIFATRVQMHYERVIR